MTIRVLTVIGARPQFIKASVVSDALRQAPGIEESVVHTGQHFDANMSEIFFSELGMEPPKFHLGIHGGGHGAMTGRMLMELETVLLAERPDLVLLYGDTNSTLAGALAASKLHIPVAHVEAGLRSFNRQMPEEINRVVTDHLSRWLFAPTDGAVAHLRTEGIEPTWIHNVGDVMFDVARAHGERATTMAAGTRAAVGVGDRPYVLATVHRQENTDVPARLEAIVGAFTTLAAEIDVVWPIHPRTRGVLESRGIIGRVPERLHLVGPQGYLDMLELERRASVIATDSGGVQKEAFFQRVPCVTLRDETEWVELVALGWNEVVPPVAAAPIVAAVRAAIGRVGAEGTPYGDGRAAQRIVQQLLHATR